MTDHQLFTVRIALIQAFLRRNNFDGILLGRVDNFAMATGGRRNHIYTASEMGVCSLFVTRDGNVYYVGNNIEESRIQDEELAGMGCDVRSFLWFKGSPADAVRKEFSGTLVSDDGSLGKNVNAELAYVRALLTADELEKYRRLGALAAEAMTAAAQSVTADMPEADIAAVIVAEGAKRRCQVPVALVAADGRVPKYRHPLPTEARLLNHGMAETRVRGYAMLVGCFLREGLVASMTRFAQVGTVPDQIPGLQAAVCGVDALMQEATVPGRTLGDVMVACQQGYVQMGFAENEWHNHHQGGATGYAGRTCKGTPGETFPILDTSWARDVKDIAGIDVEFGHAFAWNPSGPGVKSEDTFILLPDGTREIVTATPAFPRVELSAVLGRETTVVKSGFMRI